MHIIKGELCYSPYHPTRYGRNLVGHGQLFGHDLQLWNLMYLSIPRIDDYLTPGINPEEVYNSIPTAATASCIALVRGHHMTRYYPHIRYWLTLPPDKFVDKIKEMDSGLFSVMPTATNIPDWFVTVYMRACHIIDTDPASRSFKGMMDRIEKEIGS